MSRLTTQRECLTRRSKYYVLVDGNLYHKNAKEELLQKCVSTEEGKKILKEIHAGTYGNHVDSRTRVGKALAGFYWPLAVANAEALVHGCENCQFFAKQIHVLAQALQMIPTSWPFTCWGLDMIRLFKPTPGVFRWVYVCIDKFSKWIEYKPLVQATAKRQLSYSMTSSTCSAFQIASSQTWVPRSPAVTSRISVTKDVSQSSMSWWHTQGPMAKSSAPMA
jgi:hypothetical protein